MTRQLAAPVAISVLLVLAYAWYVQPDWESYRDDQFEYLALARGLVERAEFTRAGPNEAFVPEPLRTPGYPIFLAALCRTIGCGNWHIAIAQAALLAMAIPLVAVAARRIDRRAALPVGWAMAAYLPFAYFAALPLSEVAATFLLVLATACFFLARERRSAAWGLAFGASCAWLGLTRPIYLLVPSAFLIGGWLGDRAALFRAPRSWIAAAIAYAAILAPVMLGSAASFGSPSASSGGTSLWWGYFQGLGATPDAVARFDDAALREAPEAEIVAAGRAAGLEPVEATEAAYVKRRIAAFDRIDDRLTQAYAWVDLNRDLATRALVLIRHDPWGWIARGLGVRSIELWAREAPFRIRDAMRAPFGAHLVLVTAQLALLALAIFGVIHAIRAGHRDMWLVAALLVYVWLVSLPFVTEPRYSLPAKPLLLLAAVIGLQRLAPRIAGSTTLTDSTARATAGASVHRARIARQSMAPSGWIGRARTRAAMGRTACAL